MDALLAPQPTAEALRLQAESAAQANDLMQARALLTQAEHLDGQAVAVQVDLAVVCFQLQDHRNCLVHCAAALARDEQLDECVFLQVLCLKALGETRLARALLQELMQGPRAARLAQRAPAMAAEAAQLWAEGVSAAPSSPPVPASPPAASPAPTLIRLPGGREARSVREFIWGDQDPYQLFPKSPTQPPQKGWYSDHPVFEQLFKERRPKHVLEVGSLLGASAIHMGKLMHQHRIDGSITCVDTFLGSCEHYLKGRGFWRRMLASGRYNFFDEFLGNVEQAGVSDVVTPFVQTSTNAARLFRDIGVRFDLIYLDASHEYEDVLADLRAWYPLLAPGGVLVGDDFEEPWFEIIRAVMEFAEEIRHPLKTARAFASSPNGGRENTKFLFYAR